MKSSHDQRLSNEEDIKKLPPKKRVKFTSAESEEDHTTTLLTTTAPQITTTYTHFFQQPVMQKPAISLHPLRAALMQHFALMNPATLNVFHFSEILREIACYHRMHRHQRQPSEGDILGTILFLYEKAVLICPLSVDAKQQLQSYKDHQPHKMAPDQNQLRLQRYASECASQGAVPFFWNSLDKYIDRLKSIYPDADKFNFVLGQVCSHLNSSITLKSMRQKHIAPEQQNFAVDLLVNAEKQYIPQTSQKHTNK